MKAKCKASNLPKEKWRMPAHKSSFSFLLCVHTVSPPRWSYSLTQAATFVYKSFLRSASLRYMLQTWVHDRCDQWRVWCSSSGALVWMVASAHRHGGGGDKSVVVTAIFVTVPVAEKKCTPPGVRVCFDAQKRACWMFCECMLFLLKFHQTVEVFFSFFF